MIVGCKLGQLECEDADRLEEIIRECSRDSMDDIWISLDQNRQYPCLAVLTNGERACAHYFGGDEMFQSCGDMEAEGMVAFCPGGEVSELPAYTVIPLEEAIACAREFVERGERPSCIQWNAL